MKYCFPFFSFIVFLFISCKKEPVGPVYNWNVGGVKYIQNTCKRDSSFGLHTITASAAYVKNGNITFVSFNFKNFPTADGEYSVKNSYDNLGQDEIFISGETNDGGILDVTTDGYKASENSLNKKAKISVLNKKIKIDLINCWQQTFHSRCQLFLLCNKYSKDSLQLSATILED